MICSVVQGSVSNEAPVSGDIFLVVPREGRHPRRVGDGCLDHRTVYYETSTIEGDTDHRGLLGRGYTYNMNRQLQDADAGHGRQLFHSAVAGACRSQESRSLVKVLAVASEPSLFWRGEGCKEIIDAIPVPEGCGTLSRHRVEAFGNSRRLAARGADRSVR